MIGHSYEIEIKSLLGGKGKADELIGKMRAADPKFVEIGSHKQLNHYFMDGDLHRLFQNTKNFVQKDLLIKFKELADKAKDFSVRTRWVRLGSPSAETESRRADGKAAPRTGASATGTGVILVIKASVDDTTSSNGTARLEWESKVDISIEELDGLVLKSGFRYQAKWSRERQEFKYKDSNVSIDKNAGYGYLSEFEMIVADKNLADETKALLRRMMKDLDIDELPQDRLARMFDFYNKNWQDYYGTDKIFTIE